MTAPVSMHDRIFHPPPHFRPMLTSADSPKVEPDLAGYKTVETAAIAPVTLVTAQAKSVSPAYLGIFAEPDARQDLVVTDIDPDSPASSAGLQPGDILKKVDGKVIQDDEGTARTPPRQIGRRNARSSRFRALGQAGERQGRPDSVESGEVGAPGPSTAWTWLYQVAAAKEGEEGVAIEQVFPGCAKRIAAVQKLKRSAKSCSRSTTSRTTRAGPEQAVSSIPRPPGGTVVATLRLAEKVVEMKIQARCRADP